MNLDHQVSIEVVLSAQSDTVYVPYNAVLWVVLHPNTESERLENFPVNTFPSGSVEFWAEGSPPTLLGFHQLIEHGTEALSEGDA